MLIKYMADIRPDRLTTCQSERKSVVNRRPRVLFVASCGQPNLYPSDRLGLRKNIATVSCDGVYKIYKVEQLVSMDRRVVRVGETYEEF
jgi:hypothetical protein